MVSLLNYIIENLKKYYNVNVFSIYLSFFIFFFNSKLNMSYVCFYLIYYCSNEIFVRVNLLLSKLFNESLLYLVNILKF